MKTVNCKMYLDETTNILAELPEDITDDIISWGYDNILFDHLYENMGREHFIHLTVLPEVKKKSFQKIKEAIIGESKFKCIFGDISIFSTNSKFDVVKIDIINDEVKKLNKILASYLESNSFYSYYCPHVTIAYVKKGCGKFYNGDKYFSKKFFEIDELTYSDLNELNQKIKLGNFL